MRTDKLKLYKTNPLKSITFYGAIFWPILIIFITILIVSKIKQYGWGNLIFFYLFAFPLEFFVIKYWKTEITTDDNEITIKRGDKREKAKWSDIIELTELLFGSGETTFLLKMNSGKKIGFSSSIENYGDLLNEIESRTGLKFKQRL